MRQFRQQFEPLLQAELSFAQRVAHPTDEERRALIAATVKWFDEHLDEFANQRPVQLVMRRETTTMYFKSSKRLPPTTRGKRFSRAWPRLSPPRCPRKRQPSTSVNAASAEFERDVLIANLVDRLDEKLILSAEPRRKITDALTQHWSNDWLLQLENFTVSADIWPQIPDKWVRPELNTAQKAVLNRLSRSTQGVRVGGLGIGGNNIVIDDVDLDEGRPAAQPGPEG